MSLNDDVTPQSNLLCDASSPKSQKNKIYSSKTIRRTRSVKELVSFKDKMMLFSDCFTVSVFVSSQFMILLSVFGLCFMTAS